MEEGPQCARGVHGPPALSSGMGPTPGSWGLAWGQAGAAAELPTESSVDPALPGEQSSYETPQVTTLGQ